MISITFFPFVTFIKLTFDGVDIGFNFALYNSNLSTLSLIDVNKPSLTTSISPFSVTTLPHTFSNK